MQLDDHNAQRSTALGAYWKDELPAAPYRILPSFGARFARGLIVLSVAAIGVAGILAGFVAYVLLE